MSLRPPRDLGRLKVCGSGLRATQAVWGSNLGCPPRNCAGEGGGARKLGEVGAGPAGAAVNGAGGAWRIVG